MSAALIALEVRASGAVRPASFEGPEVVIGRDPASNLVLAEDAGVSRHHALVARVGPIWSVRDLASKNGTHLNGRLLAGERQLLLGDVIRVGTTSLTVVRLKPLPARLDSTTYLDPLPLPTPTERRVLVLLCRPLGAESAFREPSSVKEIAAQMVVTEAAVRQHLGRLYAKFGIPEGRGRRTHLANEALRMGVIRPSELG
jgi:FHA domain-containing protein